MTIINADRQLRNRKEHGVYYTNELISKLLVNCIKSSSPDSVLELGAGAGSLIQAASERWNEARFLTADICEQPLFNLPGVNHEHHSHLNVLDLNLPSNLGIKNDIDVAICNPPYITPKWKSAFSSILEEAGLDRCIEFQGQATGELLFLAQNLRLLRTNGHLGIIVPDGLISGERTEELRSALLSSHRLSKVIQLPRGIFPKTEAKAHILILENQSGPTESVELHAANSRGELSSPTIVSLHQAEKRLDYSFYDQPSFPASWSQAATIASITQDLVRGSIGWSQSKTQGPRVFHTVHFKQLNERGCIESSMIGKSDWNSYRGVCAERGDILIGRVGRNVPHLVGMVRTGPIPISDCIYRLRLPADYRSKTYAALTSKSGRYKLRSELRGVGAQYLTRNSILKFRIE